MRVDDNDENAISKKPPLLIARRTSNNAQNTQDKLGVVFEVREHDNI